MKTKTQTQKKPKTETPTPAKTQAAVAAPKPGAKPKASRLSPELQAAKDRAITKREGKRPPKEMREPEGDLVVFAFRLAPEERDLIHKAAGPARASKFVRALAVAAACHDEAAIKLLLQSTKPAA